MCDTTTTLTWLCTCPAPQGFAQWFIALGTVGAVLVATLGSWIKRRFYRPKVEFCVDTKSPYLIKKESQNDNASEGETVEIRIGLKNSGRSSAGTSPEAYIESYYKKVSDSYVEQLFDPIYLKDAKGNRLQPLVPKRHIYIPIISLINDANGVTTGTTNASNPNVPPQITEDYNVYIGNKCLGKGEFIIPIRFSAYKIAITGYLKVYWNSAQLDTSPNNLVVKFISERKFISLEKN